MKLIPAVTLAVSLVRAAAAPAVQVSADYTPPPSSGYYGDYGPPLRYVLALSSRGSTRFAPVRCRRRVLPLWG